ncbi:SAM-dependent methyltransferase [Cyanobium sp. Copco_Reservoir_LC18]|uniref:class I SAM-dependent methyltransferase n=1 Tax=Cyanobium sp. Copco_Reservoir_LC18 TaxID=1328305 RepID=UPI00135881A1|nr:class I SAM-dependent methyltransferase [Cyanobium sp. Copco_Reservoir_LC18]KAF0652417.1 SAM-dependent methyltransferase [Cyanobium sp. Copco_Reservoir_LC18]
MDSTPAYPIEKTYGAFLHRELSVSWILLATLMGGRHRVDPGLIGSSFRYLDVGCGHGLNLLFNAAAHPEASFYGVDLNPSHIAGAHAKAEALGLGNVHFALADLTTFAEGLPSGGPCRGWPESYDFVVAHGVASWVGAEVRTGLITAASERLRPGGIFYCSYNTYPGWLSRSTLQMLSVEEAARAGGSTSLAGIRKAAQTLLRLSGTEDSDWPLGRELPELRSQIEKILPMPESYLVGEYQAAHQPLYVGPMHRLCSAHGLSFIGSASLPEMFPEMLDPDRRALVMEAADDPMREVLLDLAINQTFRRDLFARGACPPSPPWRRQTLADLQLHASAGSEDERDAFDTSLGRLGVDPDFVRTLKDVLTDGPQSLGWLMEQASLDLEDAVMRLSVLVGAGVIGVGFSSVAESSGPAIAAFNQRCLDQITAGEEIGALLSPVLQQPVTISPPEAFFLQVADSGLPAEGVAQMVWMGITMAGGNVNDAEGRPIKDPSQALGQLQEFWESFASGRLPVLRRLGLGA